jgi:mycothiol synthase
VDIPMSYIVREYREIDFDQVSNISHYEYAKKTGSFSLVSNLQNNRMLSKFVVIGENEHVKGYGLIWEQTTSPYLILKVEILFRPEYENLSVAEILFEKINNDIQMINPDALQARIFDDQTYLLRFYRKYGFVENHRMMHVYLTVSDTDYSPYVELENRLNSQGITISTLTKEQISDTEYFPKLQTLNNTTWVDYPTEPLLPPSSPSDIWLTHEDNIPDAYFIAKKGELYIGHSHLMKMPSDSQNLIQGLTASLREFRGKGIATALKVKGIEYAKRTGYRGIFTSHRNNNIPMETVNKKLGWRPNYSEIRLEKMYIFDKPSIVVN